MCTLVVRVSKQSARRVQKQPGPWPHFLALPPSFASLCAVAAAGHPGHPRPAVLDRCGSKQGLCKGGIRAVHFTPNRETELLNQIRSHSFWLDKLLKHIPEVVYFALASASAATPSAPRRRFFAMCKSG